MCVGAVVVVVVAGEEGVEVVGGDEVEDADEEREQTHHDEVVGLDGLGRDDSFYRLEDEVEGGDEEED